MRSNWISKRCFVLGIALGLLFSGTALAVTGGESQIANTAADESNSKIPSKVYSLQIPFIENKGQIDEKVRFYVNTFAGTVFITDKGEIVYNLIKTEAESQERKSVVIKESPGSLKESEIKGINRAETKVNYFLGDKDRWKTDIPAWQEVSIGEVYEGIELKLRAYGNSVEKLFAVHPQGSVSDIKLKIEGSKGLRLGKDGELEIETEIGTVKFTKPVAYQEINGRRVEVAAAYSISQSEYGFQVGDYDRSKTLIIDPVLVYSTYLGGSGTDYGHSIAIDSSGNIYVSGRTNSTDFPIASPLQASNAGDFDAFVTKINPSGSAVIYSTYLGGSGKESGCGGIAIDSSGNAYIAGYTYSDDFPTTASAFQGSRAGDRDGYVTKIDASGSALVYSTYLGGSGFDWPCGWSIVIDSSRNAYVVGVTGSTDFPTTASAFQGSYAGGTWDVFVTKINPSGSALVYSTYIGGSDKDAGWSIAVDSSGNAYIAGYSYSGDFPTTASALQGSHAGGGGKDVIVVKINASGSDLLYSTYLGGSGTDDYGHGIAVDSSGNAYVTGKTNSTDFPTASPLQASNAGGRDVFVTKINPSGSALLYSTYLGGNDNDFGMGIITDSSGNAYLTGKTKSTDFPTASALQASNAGGWDAFVSGINASGSALLYSTYLGGSGTDIGWGVALDSSNDCPTAYPRRGSNAGDSAYPGRSCTDFGRRIALGGLNIYITGRTNSTDFPTVSPLYGSNAGGNDAFVTKIMLDQTIPGGPGGRVFIDPYRDPTPYFPGAPAP